jgi:hypothetical protein
VTNTIKVTGSDDCFYCPFYRDGDDDDVCLVTGLHGDLSLNTPDWCPLLSGPVTVTRGAVPPGATAIGRKVAK